MPLSEYWTFAREFRERFHTTGAVAPSSRFLAQAITSPWRSRPQPSSVLEVGPGTGSFTNLLVQHLGPADRVHLVELNDRFVVHLRDRLRNDPQWQQVADRVQLTHGPVQEVCPNDQFDYLICGLPFNNFESSLVRSIFRQFEQLVRPGGCVSYFEYVAVRGLKAPFVGSVERKRLGRVARSTARFRQRYRTESNLVLRNVPPAWARHLWFESSS